jgi:two-component system, LytTR family, response regulator
MATRSRSWQSTGTDQPDHPLQVLIVDDEAPAREVLRELLRSRKDVERILEAGSAAIARQIMEEEEIDLVILDIDLPDRNGLSVMRDIGEQTTPLTVFVTASPQFAPEPFEARAIDYLVKPVCPDRLSAAVDRARSVRSARQALDASTDAPQAGSTVGVSYSDKLVVKVGTRYLFERTEDIVWIEAEGNYVRIHLPDRQYVLRQTLSELETSLDPNEFVRVHRSSIINLSKVDSIEALPGGNFVFHLVNAARVASGRMYRSQVSRLIRRA